MKKVRMIYLSNERTEPNIFTRARNIQQKAPEGGISKIHLERERF